MRFLDEGGSDFTSGGCGIVHGVYDDWVVFMMIGAVGIGFFE